MMISSFFQYLVDSIKSIVEWVVNFFHEIFDYFVELYNSGTAWVNNELGDFASSIVNFLLSFVPPENRASYTEGIVFLHGFWQIADSFVPLSETLALVLTYIVIYLAVKLVLFIVRLVVGFIDIIGGLGFP